VSFVTETKSIKVTVSTYHLLKQAAKMEHSTLAGVLDKLVTEYENRKFFEAVNAAYQNMTPDEWDHELKERRELDLITECDRGEQTDEAW
jgi:hypothetical protein